MNAPDSADRDGNDIMQRIIDQAIDVEDATLLNWVTAHGVVIRTGTVQDVMTMTVPSPKILKRLLRVDKAAVLAPGNLALMVQKGYIDIVEIMLDAGADVDSQMSEAERIVYDEREPGPRTPL